MAKFDRKTERLKARVQFIRGSLSKKKGDVLSDAEVEAMSDDDIRDQVDLEVLERFERGADEPAAEGGKPGGGKPPQDAK